MSGSRDDESKAALVRMIAERTGRSAKQCSLLLRLPDHELARIWVDLEIAALAGIQPRVDPMLGDVLRELVNWATPSAPFTVDQIRAAAERHPELGEALAPVWGRERNGQVLGAFLKRCVGQQVDGRMLRLVRKVRNVNVYQVIDSA